MCSQLIVCSGHDKRITDYENMEGPVLHYQVSGYIKETGQEEQGAYADYEPMQNYVNVL